ncbi:hypothetical protein ACSX1A_02295 [Pontibacter sp. MBLB2868]|uniref:hypothetical protein n=1 Tax=Pontibacter sp. MBLB2868 TaxID=3451555 RepID=UPI003F74CD34
MSYKPFSRFLKSFTSYRQQPKIEQRVKNTYELDSEIVYYRKHLKPGLITSIFKRWSYTCFIAKADAIELIPVLVLSASRVSGDERERGSPRHEGRKGKQRDAARRGLPARRAPKLEMKQYSK